MLNTIGRKILSSWEEDVAFSRTITSFVYERWVQFEKLLKPIRQQTKKVSFLAFVAVVATYVLVPNLANADVEAQDTSVQTEIVEMIIGSMQNETESYGRLPIAQNAPARRHYTIPITAYTSEVGQTDDTPCITASGLDVCERNLENVVAANFLPIGTRVKIPELYGDRIFYVEDRMNARYYYKMDIWMKELSDAKGFGVQYATIEVF